jgi:hypothetical protein
MLDITHDFTLSDHGTKPTRGHGSEKNKHHNDKKECHHKKDKCCRDRDVFEFTLIGDKKVVRQNLGYNGYPDQDNSVFMFAKQTTDADEDALYYDPELNIFSVGDVPYDDIPNLLDIGRNNTIRRSSTPTVIGSSDLIRDSDDVKVFGSSNKVINSPNVEIFGDSNGVKASPDAVLLGNENAIVSKTKLFLAGNANSAKRPSQEEDLGVILGQKNVLDSESIEMTLGKYYLSGIDNKVTSNVANTHLITGIDDTIKATTSNEIVVYGTTHTLEANSFNKHNSIGVGNSINAEGVNFVKTQQHGAENVIRYISVGDASNAKLSQNGTDNEIVGDFATEGGAIISYVVQDGNNNKRVGYGENARQTGDYNTEELYIGYKSSQTGHGNVTSHVTLTVDQYLADVPFPATRLPDYSSTIDTIGTVNILSIPELGVLNAAIVGTANKASVGTNSPIPVIDDCKCKHKCRCKHECEIVELDDILDILGSFNVSISDPDTGTHHLILGDHNDLFTRNFNCAKEEVDRTIVGSANTVDSDTSQTHIYVNGSDNKLNVSEAKIENIGIVGTDNNATIVGGSAGSMMIGGSTNAVDIDDSTLTNIRIEGSANIFTSANDTIKDVQITGGSNTLALVSEDDFNSTSVRLNGVGNNITSQVAIEGMICNAAQEGVNNYLVTSSVTSRQLTNSIQEGTGNVITDGNISAVQTIGVDQRGASNYITTASGYTGYVSQHGAINYTDVRGTESGVNFAKRTVQEGGVIDLAPDALPQPVDLQYEELRGFGFLQDDGVKSIFQSNITNYGEGHVNDNIIGASLTRSMVGRGLGHNAQEFNAQGSGYATMFSSEGKITPCRFVTIDANGLAVLATLADGLIIGVSSVNAGFRSFEEVVYQDGYYSVNDNQSTVFVDYNTKVEFMKEMLALFCCKSDFINLTTRTELIDYSLIFCPDATAILVEIDQAPDTEYTVQRPEALLPMTVFQPKSKQPNYTEVTLNGIAYVETVIAAPSYTPGTRVSNDAAGLAIADPAGEYIIVDGPIYGGAGEFVPVTRLLY